MEEPPSIRSWNCVIVDSDSPLGKVASSVCDLTAHLPDPDVTFLCSVCFGKQWPCERFDLAAREVLAARLSLAASSRPNSTTDSGHKVPNGRGRARPEKVIHRAQIGT